MMQDVKGQTQQILSEIDRLPALAGSTSTVVSATNHRHPHRDAMNEARSPDRGQNLPGRAASSQAADPRML
jgi:hypothetical protein